MILFMDGADHLNSVADAQAKYWTTAAVITFPAGRYGSGKYMSTSGGQFRAAVSPSGSTIVVGAAIKPAAVTEPSLALYDIDGNLLCSVGVNNFGALYISVGGTITVVSSQDALKNASVWRYLEAKIVFSTSATGSASVRLDGVAAGSVSSLKTSNTTRTAPGIVQIACSGLDDVYVCDGSGSANNDFLGDLKVSYLAPSGAGSNTNWSKGGSASANYSSVNETAEDGDTTYVYSSTVAQTDTYALGDLGANDGAPKALQGVLMARADVASGRQVTATLNSGGTGGQSAALPLTPNYLYKLAVFETDPATGAAWTKAAVNALEMGVTVSA